MALAAKTPSLPLQKRGIGPNRTNLLQAVPCRQDGFAVVLRACRAQRIRPTTEDTIDTACSPFPQGRQTKRRADARHRLLQGHAFYTALITVHRQSFGLTLSVITSMEAAHTVLMLLLVLPWGIFADRFGYKRTLLFCNGLYALSKFCFLFAEGYFLFLMERLLRAAAISGLSSLQLGLFISFGGQRKGPQGLFFITRPPTRRACSSLPPRCRWF